MSEDESCLDRARRHGYRHASRIRVHELLNMAPPRRRPDNLDYWGMSDEEKETFLSAWNEGMQAYRTQHMDPSEENKG